MSVRQLRESLEPEALRTPGVTGIGNLEDRIRLYVEGTPDIFPKHIDGVRVEVVKTGKLKPLALMNVPWFVPQKTVQPLRTTRHRPVPGGVSIGHPSITAGTLGVTLNVMGGLHGLSNNHVLAAASSTLHPRASIGDHIYQPGVYDGGTEQDTVGHLAWYMPFNEGGQNVIDAALVAPASEDLFTEEILDIGVMTGVAQTRVGDTVQKSGRTTGLTVSEVLDVNATIKVDYGAFELTFVNQIITNYMADGGDSGSALLNMDLNLVGLLYAGSPYVTVHNHIANVLSAIRGVGPGAPSRNPFAFMLPTLVGALTGGLIG